MKKRIVALILTVVMSLLALTSCGGYDFAEDDLTAYVDFNLDEFNKALKNIKIADGDFTGDETTRDRIVKSTIYNTVANKLITNSVVADRFKTGDITSGDAIYFVYYAVDADGNQFFFSEMDETSVTAAATKENHTVKLGDFIYTKTSSTKDDEKFLQLVIDSANLGDIEKYIYSTLTKSEIEANALAALKETNPDATDDEKTDAKKEALTVKDGDVICVSYTRTYKTAEGVEFTETASYHVVKVDATSEDKFVQLFLAEGNTAMVGSNLSNEDNKFEIEGVINAGTEKEETVTYSYSNINIRWKEEKKGEPIATFKYTPYTTTTAKTPSSLYMKDKTIDLANKELTYYVYPVYALDIPAYDELTAYDVLYYVYGSNLKVDTLEVLSDNNFKFNGETVEKLIGDITKIYNPSAENNEFYADDTNLAKLNKEYNDAVTAGGSSPTTEQSATIATKKAALTNAQDAELKKVVEKIGKATNASGEGIVESVKEQHYHNIYHGLAETYNEHVISAVETEIIELIGSSVTVKSYPEKLVKEFRDHLYEAYEYEFYKGDYDKTTTNYVFYGTFENYLIKTLGLNEIGELDAVLEKKAKDYIDPMLKIHALSQYLAPQALEVISGYIEKDIAGGMYFDDNGQNDAKAVENVRKWSDKFIVDDAYMKQYKKIVGSAVYRNEIDTYGELNLRTAKQFEVLFYYLTCTDVEYSADNGHLETVFKDGKVAFRTIKYDFE